MHEKKLLNDYIPVFNRANTQIYTYMLLTGGYEKLLAVDKINISAPVKMLKPTSEIFKNMPQ